MTFFILNSKNKNIYLTILYIKNEKKISKKFISDLFMGLEILHENFNIIHNDIKPDNLLIKHYWKTNILKNPTSKLKSIELIISNFGLSIDILNSCLIHQSSNKPFKIQSLKDFFEKDIFQAISTIEEIFGSNFEYFQKFLID